MIRLNRIGNKLALVSAIGMAIAVGMTANQIISKAAVEDANNRADTQRTIGDYIDRTQIDFGNVQILNRNVRLAKTAIEVTKGREQLESLQSSLDERLAKALALTRKPETRQRLEKIKALIAAYIVDARELADLQLKSIGLTDKRGKLSDDWTNQIRVLKDKLNSSDLPESAEVSRTLQAADGALTVVRANTWRFIATEEFGLKERILLNGRTATDLVTKALAQASDDKASLATINEMAAELKAFLGTVDDTIKGEEAKTQIRKTRSVVTLGQLLDLMNQASDAMDKGIGVANGDAQSALDDANRLNLTLSVLVMLSLLGAILFGFFGVARPMTRLHGAMNKMAAGDLDVEISGADRGDEIGDMAKTITVIRVNAEDKAREEAVTKAGQDRAAAELRKREMHKLADDFENAVGRIVNTVSSASTQLESSAAILTSSAERAEHLTTVVAAASEEASTNVQSVASATEEMSSSVNEISRQVQESADIAHQAVDQARRTNDRVGELSKAASRIGDVVELINTIAGQTNLLALNATIEAARAGEAGRGFAVVASEVKALAEQTAKATGEISAQINGIQSATQESVGAIKEIGGTIGRMSEIASTIASAVEEQGAATQEISRNVQQAAHGTQQVSANIADVQRGASETGTASSQVLSAAQSLSGESKLLKQEVEKFLNSVRAA
jgi:methyl-accepting chemotaxis protein